MKKNLHINLDTNNLVSVQDHRAVTTSLQVAEYFGKPHNDVLKSIRALDCSQLFREGNYSLSSYSRKNGNISKTYPMYYMTRDGFTFLAMGFTGKVAARFKEAYINAFNEMENMLRKGEESRYAGMLLKIQVESFSKRLKMSIIAGRKAHGIYYGPYGDLTAGLCYFDSMSFEENLSNVFAMIQNAYLDGYFAVSEMEKRSSELDDLKKSVSGMVCELQCKINRIH